MAESRFVYVTYIRTTAEKLWQALIDPEFTRKYWVETWQECEWKTGASWQLKAPDGRVADSGEILEIDPPRRLVLKWQNQFVPEMRTRKDIHSLPTSSKRKAIRSSSRSFMRWISRNRSSSAWCPMAGRPSSRASRACSKPVSRSK